MHRTIATLLMAGAVALAQSPALAAEFRIAADPGHVLVLDMPAGWKAHTRDAEGQSVRNLVFSPPDGSSFQVLVSVIALPGGKPPPSLSDLRQSTQAAADRAEADSVETILTTVDLIGPEVGGAYFNATDRAPPPGEYEHLTQGVLATRSTVLTFTVLANDDAPGGPQKVSTQALAALRAITRVAE